MVFESPFELALVCDIALTGEIRTTSSDLCGRNLQLGTPDKLKESRFGAFTVSHSSGKSVNTLIRRKTSKYGFGQYVPLSIGTCIMSNLLPLPKLYFEITDGL